MRAVTRPLADVVDLPPDLNDVAGGDGYLFVRDGVGVAGRGVAARVGKVASITASTAYLFIDTTSTLLLEEAPATDLRTLRILR